MASKFMINSFVTLLFATSAIAARFQTQKRSCFDCLVARNVPYADPTSSNWTSLSTPYNLRLQYEPAFITTPTTLQQVRDSVYCANLDNVKVQPKSGGHSYASFSSGGQNGSAIIDLENFNNIIVDQTTYIAGVGAGVRIGNLAEAIYAQGQRALPHGTCPGVGIGGHATHGGYGHSSRAWGLTLDTIVGLDVVLADGNAIYVSETQYPDLFYAMRGAGESFGIVTTFYLQTVPAPRSVLSFSANMHSMLKKKDVAAITTAFENLQNFVLTSSFLTPALSFGIYTDSNYSLSLGGTCMNCDPKFFNNNTFPDMLHGWTIDSKNVTAVDWLGALQILAGESEPLKQPLHNYSEHNTFYAKSVVTKNSAPLETKAIQSFWQYMVDNQNNGTLPFYSIINLYGGPESAINGPESSASSYVDRDALWVFQNYGYTASGLPPWDNRITTLVDGLQESITNAQPTGNFSGYINYVDPSLDAAQAANLYYGEETYNELLLIKSKYDPNHVFWNPQSIGNAGNATLTKRKY